MRTEKANRTSPALLEAHHLYKTFRQRHWMSHRFQVTALHDVNLRIKTGSTVALVGESGSGKSTLGRCLVGLSKPDAGEIRFDGENILTFTSNKLLTFRRTAQFVFQDPVMALNPRLSAAEIVEEPLLIQKIGDKAARRKQALALMEQVGLSPAWGDRSPLEFSGGERQRLAFARALVLQPSFLVLDEALSGLDLSIQAQMANLLMELQRSLSLTYLFISHDLRLAAYLSDQIAVMQHGKIVEFGNVSQVFFEPQHSYTRQLIHAIPGLEPNTSTPKFS